MRVERLLIHANYLTKEGTTEYNQAIAIQEGHIKAIVPMALANTIEATIVDDCQHRLVTPGLIDCHTHLVYAGNRVNDYRMRLSGHSYEALLAAANYTLCYEARKPIDALD